MGDLIGFAIFLAYLFLWACQFVQLMLLTDNDFPGKSDKILWLVVFIIFWFLAPVVFIWWKKSYLHVRNLEQND